MAIVVALIHVPALLPGVRGIFNYFHFFSWHKNCIQFNYKLCVVFVQRQNCIQLKILNCATQQCYSWAQSNSINSHFSHSLLFFHLSLAAKHSETTITIYSLPPMEEEIQRMSTSVKSGTRLLMATSVYRKELILAVSRLPQTHNNYFKMWCTTCKI
jgi:hypothetical protein